MGLQLLAYFLAILVTTTANKRGYVLTTSPYIIPGSTHKACLSLHHVIEKAHVHVDLQDTTTKNILASQSMVWDNNNSIESKPLGINCLGLAVPSNASSITGLAILKLRVRLESVLDYQVNITKPVIIAQGVDRFMTFIESNLQVYKPNDVVKIRVLTLSTDDFKPKTDHIKKIIITNPSDIKVARWLQVKTVNGLAEIEFPLSSEPKTGVWKIKVERHDSPIEFVETFEVREYVLPRFKVEIKGPKEITVEDKNVTYKICGKYSYGKPVIGKIIASIQIPGSYYPERYQFRPLPRNQYSKEVITGRDGCGNITFHNLRLNKWDSVKVNGTVIEQGTEKSENASIRTKIVNIPQVILEFLDVEDFAKPDLIYLKQIRAYIGSDKKPIANETIKVCLGQCKIYRTNNQGIASFEYAIQENFYSESDILQKIADQTYILTATITVGNKTTKIEKELMRWYSPSNSYMKINRRLSKEKIVKCGLMYHVDVEYKIGTNSYVPNELYYIVQSRNEIVLHSTRQIIQQEVPSHTVRNFSEILLSSNITNSKEIQTRKIPISIKITHKMAPKSSLLVYYVTDEGETVSASLTFEVQKCFNYKIHQSWSTNKPYPGETVSIRIRAPPNSLCAISSVDERTKYLHLNQNNRHEDGTSITAERVYKKRIGPGGIVTNGDPEYCTEKIKHLPHAEDYYIGQRYDYDALKDFDDSGLIVISDFNMEIHRCYKEPLVIENRIGGPIPMMAVTYERPNSRSDNTVTETVRDNFPDSWLWDLLYIDQTGKLDKPFILPDTITNWITTTYCISPWQGLGLTTTPSSTLTAFQPFFIEFSPPYSIKRGEVVNLNVQVFNYMTHSLPVLVLLDSVTGLTATMENSVVTKSLCIPSEEAVVIPITISGQKLGKLNLTITAKIDSEYPDSCGPEVVINRSDKLIKPIFVKPEGFPVEISKSSFICPTDFPRDSSATWNFSLPEDVVSESARGFVTVSGQLMTEALQNLGNLVQLPMGCGEQNMILFVPNLHVLNYLNATRKSNPKLYEEAIKNLKIGYERELNYRHRDGSFSAFGESDSKGSSWLTAFVLKSFAKARKYIFIDDKYLKMSQKWLTKRQLENGCFPNIGQVVHKDMQGALNDNSVGLTAFVLISLLDSNLKLKESVVTNAKFCLFASQKSISDVDTYTQSLVTYAFTLLGHETTEAQTALQHLLQRVHEEDGYFWWENDGSSSLSTKVETTSYAILSLIRHGGSQNMATALGAIRWLAKHRNSNGGFESTQDTILALEALALYSRAISTRHTNLQMVINMDETTSRTVRITKDNNGYYHSLPISNLPAVIDIQGSGEGCAMVQGTLRYNVHTPKGSDAFGIRVEVSDLSMFPGSPTIISVYTWYKLPDGVSNMAVVEVDMVTGYEPDRASLFLLQDTKKVIKRFEEHRDRVVFYLDNIGSHQTNVYFEVAKTGATVQNPKPAKVKVYDYYSPNLETSTSYSILPKEEAPALPHLEPIDLGRIDIFSIEDRNNDLVQNLINVPNNESITDFSPSDEPYTTNLGHNPQWKEIDDDRDLDTPDGLEGVSPVFVLPNTSSTQRLLLWTDDDYNCPTCFASFPENFTDIYCSSVDVYRVDETNTIRLDMSPSRPVIARKNIATEFTIGGMCTCQPFYKTGGHIIVADTAESYLNRVNDTLRLTASSYVFGINNTLIRQPPEIKAARQHCSARNNN